MEVPRTLKERFDKLYPGRGDKTKLTIAAIKYAIKQGEDRGKVERTLRSEQGDSSGHHTDDARNKETSEGD